VARVVVVGAGMGGLAVAARLATLGHDVEVIEASGTWGGKLGTWSRQGFTFDTGPSLLTLPAVYRELFASTGAPLEDVVALVPVDPAARYRFPASADHDVAWLDVPNASRPALCAALDHALGPGAGADWGRFLDRAHAIWQVTR
jgi:phytoene dehydrogenase-like protein